MKKLPLITLIAALATAPVFAANGGFDGPVLSLIIQRKPIKMGALLALIAEKQPSQKH